jgi:polysaccharide export outer membrane protein
MSPRLVLIALAALLSACSSVPRSGPMTGEVLSEAAEPAGLPFALVEADRQVVARLRAADREEIERLASDPAPTGPRIRVGDRLQVTLFEATGGGLFGAGVDSGAGVRELPVQIVSAAGTIRVPYAGSIRVAGLSPEGAATRIEAGLEGQAIEPQAVVSLLASPGSAVTVLGDAVASGGRVPLAGTGERVLDMVAAAGGLTKPIHESALRLTRARASAMVPVGALLERPERNVPVRAADVITVEHRPRFFSVLGAVGRNAKIPFDRTRLTLDEAVGLGKGLVDARADPAGVFVIRYEDAELLRGLPLAAGSAEAEADGRVPTVYRIDFSRPSGLLLAKRFPVRHRDTLYVANAEVNSLEKILRVVGLALQPVTTGAVIGNLAVN